MERPPLNPQAPEFVPGVGSGDSHEPPEALEDLGQDVQNTQSQGDATQLSVEEGQMWYGESSGTRLLKYKIADHSSERPERVREIRAERWEKGAQAWDPYNTLPLSPSPLEQVEATTESTDACASDLASLEPTNDLEEESEAYEFSTLSEPLSLPPPDPPSSIPDPPSAPDPPCSTQEPPFSTERPPCSTEGPPSSTEGPPSSLLEHPSSLSEPPSSLPEPPSSIPESSSTLLEPFLPPMQPLPFGVPWEDLDEDSDDELVQQPTVRATDPSQPASSMSDSALPLHPPSLVDQTVNTSPLTPSITEPIYTSPQPIGERFENVQEVLHHLGKQVKTFLSHNFHADSIEQAQRYINSEKQARFEILYQFRCENLSDVVSIVDGIRKQNLDQHNQINTRDNDIRNLENIIKEKEMTEDWHIRQKQITIQNLQSQLEGKTREVEDVKERSKAFEDEVKTLHVQLEGDAGDIDEAKTQIKSLKAEVKILQEQLLRLASSSRDFTASATTSEGSRRQESPGDANIGARANFWATRPSKEAGRARIDEMIRRVQVPLENALRINRVRLPVT